jgi:mannitol-specific phosphotransferase system IIBC component
MKITKLVVIGLMLSLPLTVQAKDEHAGKAAHDENCLKCHKGNHDEAFYTRKDRKTKDYKRLQSMVRMCDAKMGTSLFDEDMIDIGNYLNDSFYKFPKK